MSADHQALIAEALAGHRADDVGRDCIGDGMAWVYARRCDCGWRGPSDQHDAHVAAALLDSPEFAAVLADVRAGELREAVGEIERLERIGQTPADEVPDAEWEWFAKHRLRGNVADVHLHRVLPEVADWLNIRADERTSHE